MKPGAALVTVAAALLLTSLLVAPLADASFPGSNGRIAFSQGDLIPGGDLSGHSQVFTIRPSGSDQTQLTDVAADQGAGSPDWSPDGRRIAYISNESGSFQIWVMNADGSDQTQLTDDESGFENFQPSWSPDGGRIVFSHCSEPLPGFIAYCDINVMNADGSGVGTLLSAGHATNVRPQFSPDGQKVAFSSDRAGLQSAVWVMNADGSSPTRLTKRRQRAWWPDWAPSGKRILFSDHCCIPNSNLWTVRPSGAGLEQLTHVRTSDLAFPSFSPNGKRILTLSFSDKGKAVQILGSDGSRAHPVLKDAADPFLTDWGPG